MQGQPQFRFPPLTPTVRGLLLLLTGAFLLQVIVGAVLGLDAQQWHGTVNTWAALYLPTFLRGALWQPLTAPFLHAMDGWGHLIFNLVTLYLFGTLLESAIGRRRLLRLLAICALASGLAVLAAQGLRSLLLDGAGVVPTLGASGAISGVIGGVCAIAWRRWLNFFFFQARGWHLFVAIVFIDLLRVIAGAPISLVGHWSGLVIGLWLIGPDLRPLPVWRRWRAERRARRKLRVLDGGRAGPDRTLH